MDLVSSLPQYRSLFFQNYPARVTVYLALDVLTLSLLFGLFDGRSRRTVLTAGSAPPVSISTRPVAALCRASELWPTPNPG